MNPTWLIFLSLLTSAGTPRKHVSLSEALPESHLEEEDEEEDDAEENSNVEQSPEVSASPPAHKLYDAEDLLKKTAQHLQEYLKFLSIQRAEEERSQEQQEVESRFGPHYLNILGEEQSLDVSDKADLLKRNTAQETSQEDFKVNITLAVSSITLVFSLVLICCAVAFYKYRTQKRHFSNTLRCSPEQQRIACPSFFHHLKGVSNSSVPRAAESSVMGETTSSDVWSGPHSDNLKSKTLPFINSMDDVSSISAESTHSSTPSYKALNADQN